MNKIKKRTEKEKFDIGKMKRDNNICSSLNFCFEQSSLDEDDKETILRWACMGISISQLIYLFEKIKLEKLSLK